LVSFAGDEVEFGLLLDACEPPPSPPTFESLFDVGPGSLVLLLLLLALFLVLPAGGDETTGADGGLRTVTGDTETCF
jgi:hypothetical protein